MDITIPNPGKAIIAFTKAMRNAEERYKQMQNCARCSKEEAEQWKHDRDLFAHLIIQVKEKADVSG